MADTWSACTCTKLPVELIIPASLSSVVVDPMKLAAASLRRVISSEDSLQGEMSLLDVDSSAEVMLLVSPPLPVAEDVERGESFCMEPPPISPEDGRSLQAESYDGRLPTGSTVVAATAGIALAAISSGDPEDSLEGVNTSFSDSSAEVMSVLVYVEGADSLQGVKSDSGEGISIESFLVAPGYSVDGVVA